MSATPAIVVITGSECTGKTTLAARLAEHYGTLWVPEYARGYYAGKRDAWTIDDMPRIVRGQMEAEAVARAAARDLLFCDTDALTSFVYSRHYYGAVPEDVRAAADAGRADLYLLCDVDIPWVADGQRDRPHRREEMHALFRAALESRGYPYGLIRGLGEARLRAAVAAIESWRATREI